MAMIKLLTEEQIRLELENSHAEFLRIATEFRTNMSFPSFEVGMSVIRQVTRIQKRQAKLRKQLNRILMAKGQNRKIHGTAIRSKE